MSEILFPDSWVKAAFGDVFKVSGGSQPPKSTFVFEPTEGYVQLLQIRDFGEKTVPTFVRTDSVSKFCAEDDILIARYGASLGRILTGLSGAYNVALAKVIFDRTCIDSRYVFHYLQTQFFQTPLKMMSRSAQNGFSEGELREFIFPLPPLPEQKRIVAKIEELFSELEAGEASLRKARRQLGVYRQSLLKQAFEGKLTQTWRTQNPDKLESPAGDISPEELNGFPELPRGWRYTRFGHFIRHIDAGKSFRCEERRPSIDEVGVAKVSAVTWGEYDEAESKTCVDPEKVNPDYFIRPGDFVLSRANTIELVGACVIVRRVTQQIMLSDKTLRITMDDALKPFFLHYLRSRQGRLEIEKRSTGNQESMRNIGQERIRSIIVPECSLPEQQEIVRLLDEQFEAIERNERELDAALRRSEALRQAILKKAFTGRLVPQSPADEPASALLARLRAERESSASPSKRRRASAS